MAYFHFLTTQGCLKLAVCIAVCVANMAWAEDKPVMRWWQVHLPPYSILVNDQPTTGAADERLRLIMAQWPEVKHEFINVKSGRLWKDLAEPDANACNNTAIITPEREKNFYLSATNLVAPVDVIAKPSVLKNMAKNARGEVLPGALFDRNDLTGIINPGRSYGVVLGTMLSRRSPKAKIEEVIPWSGNTNVLEMIANGRADYTLEFERTLTYLTVTTPRLKDAGLETAHIAGGAMSQVGIACPRNAWGYAAIKKIDAIVTSLARNPEFQQNNNMWISAKERAYLKTASDEFFKARAKPTPPDRYAPP